MSLGTPQSRANWNRPQTPCGPKEDGGRVGEQTPTTVGQNRFSQVRSPWNPGPKPPSQRCKTREGPSVAAGVLGRIWRWQSPRP